MLNDQDDNKYESHEESEYHFSDEEVSYDVEHEQESSKAVANESKENSILRLVKSKRILISGGVFIVMVFVVYKMVSPSSVQSMEMGATPVVAQQTTAPATNPTVTPPPPVVAATQSTPPSPPTAAITPPTTAPNLPPPGAIAAAQPPSTIVQVPPPASTPAPTQVAASTTPPTQSVAPSMPAVIPVQSATPASPTLASLSSSTPVVTPITQTVGTSYQIPGAENANAMAAMMTQEREKIVSQLQADYEQKISTYAMQNKVIESQMQALDARVVGLQSQLNQLLKAFQTQNTTSENSAAPATTQRAEAKIPYNVQAIIPGRAWLKSENGETIT
ncbi:MAG: hypothetical protein JO149_00590, partial [Gammaproteobacteria bacterium]|nr:hypothetical protein [Gammaproteobacteria bacterium]